MRTSKQYRVLSLNDIMMQQSAAYDPLVRRKCLLPVDVYGRIKPGFIVKLQVEAVNKIKPAAEAFWVIVMQKRGDDYKGIVNNKLERTVFHGLKFGDSIKFGNKHILDVQMLP